MQDSTGDLFLRHDWSGPEVRHLEMIQRTIDRLSRQSFQLRILAGAVVAVALGVSAGLGSSWPLIAGAVTSLALWAADAACAEAAGLYRRFFDGVRERKGTDFRMAPDGAADLMARRRAWAWTALSPAVFGLHAPLVLVQFVLLVGIEGHLFSLGRGF